MLSKEQKRDYQKAYMARKRSNSGSNKEDGSNRPSTSEGLTRHGVGLTDLEPTMAGAWRSILDYYQRAPDRFTREVNAVCSIAGAGECTRYGTGGPTLSDIKRILRL